MTLPDNIVDRSPEMLISSYYLARCGLRHSDKPAKPPAALGVSSWKAAYDIFFDAMGDGRTAVQFRNSMKNARDSFDVLFDNGRVGWVDEDGQKPSFSRNFRRVAEEWEYRSDHELERFVFRLLTGASTPQEAMQSSGECRTEGGLKVYISRQRERDGAARMEAIRIHGYKCVACGFDFEAAYGSIGEGYIEVHHVVPLASSGERETDPRHDLTVLCANCHRMVHRKPGICLTIDELRAYINCSASESAAKNS